MELGSRSHVTLAELGIVTGRSRSSVYRDIKKLDIKVRTLINGHIPYIRAEELWRFHSLPWFQEYAGSVNAEAKTDSEHAMDLEEQWKQFVPATELLKLGFDEGELKRLLVSGFLPAIKAPGMWLIKKPLYYGIEERKKQFNASN